MFLMLLARQGTVWSCQGWIVLLCKQWWKRIEDRYCVCFMLKVENGEYVLVVQVLIVIIKMYINSPCLWHCVRYMWWSCVLVSIVQYNVIILLSLLYLACNMVLSLTFLLTDSYILLGFHLEKVQSGSGLLQIIYW